MTSLALHSQHLWTLNFSRLQMTRDLTHRLEESTAILETYFIKTASAPNSMIETKSAHLLYLDKPKKKRDYIKGVLRKLRRKLVFVSYPVASGY